MANNTTYSGHASTFYNRICKLKQKTPGSYSFHSLQQLGILLFENSFDLASDDGTQCIQSFLLGCDSGVLTKLKAKQILQVRANLPIIRLQAMIQKFLPRIEQKRFRYQSEYSS